MKKTGYIDRVVENNIAVVLINNTNETRHIIMENLPKNAKVGDYLDIEVENEKILTLTINKELTESQSSKINHKLNKLKMNSKGSKFKK